MELTAKTLAAQLNGREYGNEITKEEEIAAKENWLVVVFGYSDDNAEFRGVINDEVGCFNGGDFLLDSEGLLEVCDEDCVHYQRAVEKAKKITANWDSEWYSWTYSTDIEHETFEILEDGEKFCRGIVFEIADLK